MDSDKRWLGLNPDTGMNVCSGSDCTFNEGLGLFSSHVQKIRNKACKDDRNQKTLGIGKINI